MRIGCRNCSSFPGDDTVLEAISKAAAQTIDDGATVERGASEENAAAEPAGAEPAAEAGKAFSSDVVEGEQDEARASAIGEEEKDETPVLDKLSSIINEALASES
jgi:hypothetical protein